LHCQRKFAICWIHIVLAIYKAHHHRDISALVNKEFITSLTPKEKSSNLKMEAVHPLKMSVTFYWTIGHHISEKRHCPEISNITYDHAVFTYVTNVIYSVH
jgi:hypothetical protein